MAVLIDPPVWPAHGQVWSHLVSDSSYAELHEFARALGVPRRGFDLDHYDLPERLYRDAVALGAAPVSGRELLFALQRSGLRVRQSEKEALRRTRRDAYLREEWQLLAEATGIAPAAGARLAAQLLTRWREPHRRYHDERHLEDVLLALDQLTVGGEAVTPAVLLAAWFHDAIYTGRAGADERACAELAVRELSPAGVHTDTVAGVHDLIVATIPPGASSANGAYAVNSRMRPDRASLAQLLDSDLWIFAAPPSRYERYTLDVRAEYASVAEPRFRSGRAQILTAYLERPALYETDFARTRWEARARSNVTAELAGLSGHP
ncbi:DUF4031 domain-containing protein [Leucobacter sp. HY1908]